MFLDPLGLLFVVLAVGLGVTGTVIGARRKTRPGLVLGVIGLALVVIALLLASMPAFTVYGLVLTLIAVIVGGAGVIVAAVSKSEAQQAELTAAREASGNAARVEQIRQLEAAYADAHEGAAPPAGYTATMMTAAPAQVPQTTNGFALAGFIFGLLGGWLGIVFGFVALSQIKRTGQPGRGLAIAGITIAFVWIGLYLLLIAVPLITGLAFKG